MGKITPLTYLLPVVRALHWLKGILYSLIAPESFDQQHHGGSSIKVGVIWFEVKIGGDLCYIGIVNING